MRTRPPMKRRARGRKRGFSHVTMTIEAAAVMGWFVVLVLGEKYMNDATLARRAAEKAAHQSAVSSAMSYCGAGGLPGISNLAPSLPSFSIPGVGVHGGVGAIADGGPAQNVTSEIQTIVSILGLGSLKTLPLYSKPFQAAAAEVTAARVKAAAPLGFTSNEFHGVRNLACLERSLDSPGAPFVNLASARTLVFVRNILGY